VAAIAKKTVCRGFVRGDRSGFSAVLDPVRCSGLVVDCA
jgi:hypothetical protein